MRSKPPAEPALAGQTVAITGASGFIGRRVAEALRESGAHVRALVRSRHAIGALRGIGLEPVHAPLHPGPALARALDGCAVLFHFAYDMRAGADENLAAFDALHGAAKAAGVTRIVHASSVAVYDSWPHGEIDENAPSGGPGGSPYRRAKILMEARLADGGIEAALLQPTIVWGPYSPQWTERPIAALRAGGLVLPEPVGTCPAVYVDDVAQGALKAAAAAGPGVERFLIDGPDAPSWQALFEGYAAIIGRGSVMLRPTSELAVQIGPRPAASPAGPSLAAQVSARMRRLLGSHRVDSAIRQLAALKGSTRPALPNHNLLELYGANPRISIDKARAELGYAPQFSLSHGMSELGAVLQADGDQTHA